MSDGLRGPEVWRPGVPVGCLGSGLGRPWVLVVAMLAPVVLGGGLFVVSLLGVDVGGRAAGGSRVGVLGVEPQRSGLGPDEVYGRVVEKKVQKGGGVGERGAGGSWEVPERRRESGEVREVGAQGARDRGVGGSSGKRVDGVERRQGVECPPEEDEGEVREERAEDEVREEGVEVGGEEEVISELWVGIVGTDAE